MKEQALTVLEKWDQARILVVGDLILDRYIWGSVNRISPEAPVPVVLVNRETIHLGGAANVLGNLRSMEAQTSIVGVTGRDQNGSELVGLMDAAGVDTSGIIRTQHHPTIQKTRIIAHQQQVVRVDREKNGGYEASLNETIVKEVFQRLPRVDAIIVSDYGKGVIHKDLLAKLHSAKGKPTICVDPKDQNFANYKGVHILTPNQAEAERMSGVQITDRPSLMKAAAEIFKVLGCERLLVTRGEKGMALFQSPENLFEIPTVAKEVYDVSGAGDTVIATYALSRAVGASARVSAYLSNIAAGIVVGKLGTAEVSRQEIKDALLQRDD
ncbi:MAG: D-glycero-beta-D-manno-heptose-7-phosphate kinase [Acidobacteria bacterium]|nr:MAG: D-glycero-beta-D-manno-heptose-7-phosphate kinase [Acidobacteriota bacterium]